MTNIGRLWVEFEDRSPGPPMGVSIGPLPDKKISYESRIAHLFLFFGLTLFYMLQMFAFKKLQMQLFPDSSIYDINKVEGNRPNIILL